MSFFKTKILKKEIKECHHPWEKTINDSFSHMYKFGHNSANNPPYPNKDESKAQVANEQKERLKITVIGIRTSKEFIYCYYLVQGLYKYKKKQFEPPRIRGVTCIDWPQILNNLKIQYGGKAYCLQSQVAVIVNDTFLGGQNELKQFIESKYYVYHLCLDYYHEAIQQFASFIMSSGRPCAYMHFSIDGKEIGNMIFMLYHDLVPYTCENFLRLCATKKGGYSGTPVHRIVKDSWIQCGGFGLKDTPGLGCENFIVPHDKRGVLCMANDSRHVDCSTQFFVLLQPAPWMEHKYVAFGQLIEGETTLSKIENVPTWYESPTQEIIIHKAGVFNMDCHYRVINKNTHAYIHDHIENLYEIAEIFYEELLERVFKQIEQNKLELAAEETSDKTGDSSDTDKKRKKDIDSDDENDDFDVENYDYEHEHYSYTQATEPSLVVKPDKPYYIPLTDVPCPGELSSEFDLKRLLQGNYCLKTDLEHDVEKRKLQKDKSKRKLSIPQDLVDALFECFTFGNEDFEHSDESSDISVDSLLHTRLEDYISKNTDTVSFAGHVVHKIANIAQKFEVFDDMKNESTSILTDDELRMIRMSIREYKAANEKMVSINLSSSKLSHTKIIRRPTGYVRMEDLAKLNVNVETFESLEDGVNVVPERAIHTVEPATYKPRHENIPRASALTRLLDEVKPHDDDDYEAPTLKGYKSTLPQEKSLVLLTYSSTFALGDGESERDMRDRRWQPGPKDSIDHVLRMQHGVRIYRKLSSDYVRTISNLEQKQTKSIRALEYLQKRPWLSVPQYKMKNKKYHEKLKPVSIQTPSEEPT